MSKENTVLKIRCEGIDTAEPITSQAGLAAAQWKPQPLTLRSDELSIKEADPEETEEFSHENDDAEDYDVTGAGLTAVGSFIKASYEQMKDFLGGVVVGTGDAAIFFKSSKKTIINKALRFRLKNGGYLVIPNARGYVLFDGNLGAKDGMLKFPFKFKALAQPDFDCSIILKATADTIAPEGQSALLSAPIVEPEAEPVAEPKTKTTK